MDKIIEKLIQFKNIDDNWNENGATPISDKVFDIAKNFYEHLIFTENLFVTMTACNSVQFEFNVDNKYLEIECFEDRYETFLQTEDSLPFGYDSEKTYELNELYKVINEIKLFFNPEISKVVLFTGAFNPVTIAHEHMIESAVQHGGFNYVIFALSNQKFLDRKQRKTKDIAYSEQDRLNMVFEMTWSYKNVLIFGIEQGYTYEVLNAVKEFYNIPDLYFALGSDKLQEIQRWGFHDKLLTEFCFYILQRDDSREYVHNKCEGIFRNTKYVIGHDNKDYKDISATLVRNLIKNNNDFSKVVSPGVYQYIKQNL